LSSANGTDEKPLSANIDFSGVEKFLELIEKLKALDFLKTAVDEARAFLPDSPLKEYPPL